jgi:hypothetical protein
MSRSARKWVFIAGAAALLSSQAVSAAPASTTTSIDPLMAVSLFSSAQSRDALCAGGNACAVPAATPAVAGAAASTAALQGPPPDERPGLDLPGLVVLFFVPVAITLAIALQDTSNQPVSPG